VLITDKMILNTDKTFNYVFLRKNNEYFVKISKKESVKLHQHSMKKCETSDFLVYFTINWYIYERYYKESIFV